MPTLKRCTKCFLPETYETIDFDEQGVCSVCRQSQFKGEKIDWGRRKKLLETIIEKHRGKYEYDCVIPFSGGKDSTYTLYYLIKEYGLKPLVVTFNHGFMRAGIMENRVKTLKKLGADHLDFTPNWNVVKKVMKEAFLRKTDFCWHCHTGIYAYPLRVAVRYQVPLVFWGEPLSEFSSYYSYETDDIEYEDEEKFNMYRNLGINAEDMSGMIDHVEKRDLLPFTYPSAKELRQLKCESVCLGSFIPWDHVKQTKLIQDELGWQGDELEGVPDAVNTAQEKIECYMQGTRDYIKYLKRGYSRISQITSFDVRNQRTTREEAAKWIPLEGRKPPGLKVFLEYMGMSEEDFNEVVRKDMVPPYEHDFSHSEWAKETKDFPNWYRENNCSTSCEGSCQK